MYIFFVRIPSNHPFMSTLFSLWTVSTLCFTFFCPSHLTSDLKVFSPSSVFLSRPVFSDSRWIQHRRGGSNLPRKRGGNWIQLEIETAELGFRRAVGFSTLLHSPPFATFRPSKRCSVSLRERVGMLISSQMVGMLISSQMKAVVFNQKDY